MVPARGFWLQGRGFAVGRLHGARRLRGEGVDHVAESLRLLRQQGGIDGVGQVGGRVEEDALTGPADRRHAGGVGGDLLARCRDWSAVVGTVTPPAKKSGKSASISGFSL